MIRKLVFTFYIMICAAAQAVEIIWQSAGGSVDLQSDGVTLIDGSFEFEIGQFTTGFTPDASNVDAWKSNWTAFGTAQYNEVEGNIRGVGDLENNDIFAAGDPFYMWGFNSKIRADSEWILLKDSSWLWPTAPASGPGPPVDPNAAVVSEATGSEIIFGEANTPSFQMKTARPLLTSPYQLWIESEFSLSEQGNPAISGQQADPDGDGRVNLLEFAAGSDPNTKDASGFVNIISTEDFVDIEVNRAIDTGLDFSLLVSFDLEMPFVEMNPAPQILLEEPERLVYRVSVGGQLKNFFRVQVAE